MVTGEGLLES